MNTTCTDTVHWRELDTNTKLFIYKYSHATFHKIAKTSVVSQWNSAILVNVELERDASNISTNQKKANLIFEIRSVWRRLSLDTSTRAWHYFPLEWHDIDHFWNRGPSIIYEQRESVKFFLWISLSFAVIYKISGFYISFYLQFLSINESIFLLLWASDWYQFTSVLS